MARNPDVDKYLTSIIEVTTAISEHERATEQINKEMIEILQKADAELWTLQDYMEEGY